ncbi:MAG TPA: Na(+)-translocating NADH-quinone reductase subunit A [SAR86 cluster bacterium]|jgi:Na+-transporting NADH:ubiquinone oxidoreductase subunit A|nr:Na(+)-translocating NADH-quinone reductase subunit A [SAR86 cluster bacterium]HJM15612.1 Na(+)-translocating NADH-quinone reductase subunit A [SAR86 cluster bacterium]|tara:strand:- start:369 stop:1721 length:1353 start_codon:yes stop_codon:yes gene_type:complete
MIKIKKGLNIPINGKPAEEINDSKNSRSVAILGDDYIGMKPTMLVKEGDEVKLGQALFEDKKNPGVIFTSPAGGKIESINRGERRALQSVVIEINKDEESLEFKSFLENELNQATSDEVRDQLIVSGLWTSFRTRPYSKIPLIDSSPSNLFISALDTQPLSPNPEMIINLKKQSFDFGLLVLKKLLDCPIHISISEDSNLSLSEDDNVKLHTVSGPHPAGLVGTQMHFISPASLSNINWSIGYQDLIAIGQLFETGKINVERIISIAGPQVNKPAYFQTRLGACSDELTAGELTQRENRIISGSVISGREAIGPYAYLGRYHNQISVVAEPNSKDREFMNWLIPGPRKFSKIPLFLSSLFPNKIFKFKALMNGSDRPIVPIGVYEEVLPLNLLPSMLLRNVVLMDTEKIQALGGLELDEEDLSLCSFVCPGKYDFGSLLRAGLTKIEIEG